jgi:hypothetical protein
MAECPAPPLWRPASARPIPVWKAANKAIEDAYREEHGNHGVLVGSQFEEGFMAGGVQREVRLPQNAPNKEFATYLLENLRGPRGGPRKPDIVDFNDRAFYEIKPVDRFQPPFRAQAINQHVSLYRMADDIVREFNDMKRENTAMGSRTLATQDPWVIENAKWMPPKCLTLPGLAGQYKLDTFSTDYNSDRNCRGIIVYRVWKKVRKKEEEEQVAAKVVVSEKDETYKKLLPLPAALPKVVGHYDPYEPDHLIIVPKYVDDAFDKRAAVDIVQRVADLSVPPAFDRKNPIGQFRSLSRAGPFATNHPEDLLKMGAILGVAAGGVALLVLAAPEVAAGGGTAVIVEEGGATVISLAARRLAASAAAEAIKKAAGIILLFGTVRSIRGNDVSFSRVGAMRAIPLSSVTPYKSMNSALSSGLCIADSPENLPSVQADIRVGDTVMFDSEPHAVVARLLAYPNKLSESA